jgi:hypothetical protein
MDEELEKMKKKSKLSKDELKIFLEKIDSVDHRVDHSNAMRCMSNETRRDLLNNIAYEVRSIEILEEKFQMNADQLKYHLSMLEHSLYVMESQEGWKATPRGIGFIENAILEDS